MSQVPPRPGPSQGRQPKSFLSGISLEPRASKALTRIQDGMYTQRERVVYQEIARTNRQEQRFGAIVDGIYPVKQQAAPAVEAMLSGFDSRGIKPVQHRC